MNQDFIVHKKAISKKQAENSPPPITFLMVRPYLVSSIRLFSISDLLTVRALAVGHIVTSINAVSWHIPRQTFASLGLLTWYQALLLFFLLICFFVSLARDKGIIGRGHDLRLLACLLSLFTFARIACLLQLWIKTSDLDTLFGHLPNNKVKNTNHKGLKRTANEYAGERRIYKDLISKNEK